MNSALPTVDELLSDRDAFNAHVYTSWDQALVELEARQKDSVLKDYVTELLPMGLPSIMQGKKSMVLFRHIATPNYEVSRFMIAADALASQLQPLILEYTADKFNNRNDWKFSLAKLRFHKGHNKLNESIFEYKNVIDINESNNKPISSVNTSWGQPLVDFHHEMFAKAYPTYSGNVFDLSSWLHAVGGSASDYYKHFLGLFLRDGILFENFLLETKELEFTQNIILPALLELEAESGKKPLIVALEPTHMEGDEFWLSHPSSHMDHVVEKVQKGASF